MLAHAVSQPQRRKVEEGRKKEQNKGRQGALKCGCFSCMTPVKRGVAPALPCTISTISLAISLPATCTITVSARQGDFARKHAAPDQVLPPLPRAAVLVAAGKQHFSHHCLQPFAFRYQPARALLASWAFVLVCDGVCSRCSGLPNGTFYALAAASRAAAARLRALRAARMHFPQQGGMRLLAGARSRLAGRTWCHQSSAIGFVTLLGASLPLAVLGANRRGGRTATPSFWWAREWRSGDFACHCRCRFFMAQRRACCTPGKRHSTEREDGTRRSGRRRAGWMRVILHLCLD